MSATKTKRRKKNPDDPQPEAAPIAEAVDQVLDGVKREPVPAPDSPERLAKWDADTLRMVNRSERECSALAADHEEKAEAAKQAKKALELAAVDHWKLIRERREGRGKPQQGTLYAPPTDGHAAAEPDLREPCEVPPVEDESWKAVPIADLVERDGLPAKIAEILGNPIHKHKGTLAPILTMGDLTRYQEPEEGGYQKRLVDLKGFGPQKDEQLADACARFWQRWRSHASQPSDDATTGPADRVEPRDQPGDPATNRTADAPEPAAYQGTDGDVHRIAERKKGRQR